MEFGRYTLYIFYPSYILAIISIGYVIYGLYTLATFLRYPYICPACDKKKTMIPIDTPEAKEIIKENNLTFWKESTEKTISPSRIS